MDNKEQRTTSLAGLLAGVVLIFSPTCGNYVLEGGSDEF